ncbi:hypothetical protein HMPREF1983_01391 [Gemella bergeri ATCC 700627]|uniref:Uncharacterized protein n=1 Tax=Gemella bergeri ATCC 700627 TaxID=1321820 RepID=U2QJF0_9BACL|nr:MULTISPECIES: hypothetical protein [Gemella]AME09782.1 hypothetical protein AXE85_06240 [Gemella sp. oral taxon 928]AXI27381.1 hypothetical protein CG018_08175 [Gemella sp. ND 6198]ERK56339.1 hypothetical protein HMPREF1983_01391 [Gemella bergeri ATCC 700627]
MKKRKILLVLGLAAVTNYYLYKKYNEIIEDNEHIDRCRNKLIAKGFEVNNSYSLNLKENNYLMFYFDEKEKSYEVKYSKENEEIEYIKEVE